MASNCLHVWLWQPVARFTKWIEWVTFEGHCVQRKVPCSESLSEPSSGEATCTWGKFSWESNRTRRGFICLMGREQGECSVRAAPSLCVSTNARSVVVVCFCLLISREDWAGAVLFKGCGSGNLWSNTETVRPPWRWAQDWSPFCLVVVRIRQY